MNDALRQAMAAAQVTDRQLATAAGVDVKTIERWIKHPARVPHARHRWAACQLLGVPEEVIWPSVARASARTGPDREVVSVYPYRSAAPAALWRQLISKAKHELTFAGYTNYFLWLEQAQLGRTLRRKAESGCRVRFLVGDPDSPVTRAREIEEDVPITLSMRIAVTVGELQKLCDVPGIEAHYETGHVNISVFRFDDDMIVTPILARHVGHDSPMLHLRRCQQDGMFDRFMEHVDELWGRGRNIWDLEVQHAEA